MKGRITFLLLAFFFAGAGVLWGQPCNFPAAPSPDCATAPILCSFEFDQYCSTNLPTPNNQAPEPFCAGSDDNVQWIAFIADCADLTLNFNFSNCQNGDGIQIGVYRNLCNDCSDLSNACWAPVAACNPGSAGAAPGTYPFIMNGLTCGEQYYLIVDGWAGDICDWDIDLFGASPNPPQVTPNNFEINGPTTVSPCCPETYFANVNISNACCNVVEPLTYTWTVVGGVFADTSATTITGFNLSSVEVIWNNPTTGPIQGSLSVTGDFPCFGGNVTTTIQVDINPPPTVEVSVVGPTVLCPGCEGTYQAFPTLNGANCFLEPDDYQWSVIGGAIQGPSSGSNQVTVLWDESVPTGNHEICVDAIYSCTAPGNECLPVTVEAPPDITLDDLNLCFETDIPFFWNPCNDPTQTVIVTNTTTETCQELVAPDPTCCTRDVTQTINVNSGTFGNLDTTICAGECITVAGFPLCTDGTIPIVLPGGNVNGCDSTIFVSIQIEDPELSSVSTDESCAGNDGTIDLTVTGVVNPPDIQWDPNGATTEDLTGLGSGIYTVTVTASAGCSAVLTDTVNPTSDIAIMVDSTQDISCEGGSDGAIYLTATGSDPPFSFIWTGPTPVGDTDDGLNLSAGLYQITVQDGLGCITSTSVNLNEPPLLSINSATIVNTNCNGSADGSIEVLVVGGTPPYTYTWTGTAQDSSFVDGLTSGNYQVLVTDANGCTADSSFTITSPTALSYTSTLTDVSCNGGDDGTADIVVSGGTPPYNFSWTGGAMGNNPTNLTAGDYTFTVTDANSCTLVDSFTINEPPLLELSADSTPVSCNGGSDGSVDLTVTGGTPAYTFVWSDPTYNGTEDPTGLPAGPISVTVTDNNGCVDSLTIVITEPTDIVASATPSDALCFGDASGSIDVTVSGGTVSGDYNYTWTPDLGNVQDPTGLIAGTYSVVIEDDNGCIETIDDIVINEPDSLGITGTSTDALCGVNNGTIDITVTGGTTPYSYNWNDPAPDVEDPTGLGPGTYTVTVTDANSCTETFSITVNTPSGLSAVAVAFPDSCYQSGTGAIDLTISGGVAPYTPIWDNGLDTIEDQTGLFAGTYNVTVIDSDGCSALASATVTEPDSLALTGTVVPATCGEPNGSIDVTITGGTPPYDFTWTGNTPIGNVEDPTGLLPGTYTVVATDVNDCSIQEQFDVFTPDALNASAVVTQILCFGDSTGAIDVTITGGSPPYDLNWNVDQFDGQEDLVDVPVGNYILSIIDQDSCEFIIDETITSPTELQVSGTPTNLSCNNAGDGAIDLDVSGGVTPYTYTWTGPTPIGNTVEDPTGLDAGDYNVVITDANGCTIATDITVTQPDVLAVTGTTDKSTCQLPNGSIDLTVTGGTTPYNFTWDDPGIGNTPDPTGLFGGTYTVIITDANNCTVTDSFVVDAPDSLLANSVLTQILCFGDSTGAIDVSVTGGTTPYTYDWNVDQFDGQEDLADIPTGIYNILITDVDGCTVALTDTITSPTELLASSVSTDATCNGADDGIIEVTPQGGVTPYVYNWSGPTAIPTTTEDPNGLAPGTYDLVLEDANGCTTSLSDTIDQPEVLSFTSTSDSVLCDSGSDGSIQLTTTGGTTPYTYDWNDPTIGDTDNPTGLTAGTYTAIVTDANGCTFQDDIIVDQPTPIVINDEFITNVDCNGNSTGAIELDISGGTGAYTVNWNTGQSGNPYTDLAAGTYIPVVEDANGCILTGQAVTVTEPDALEVSFTSEEATCGEANGSIDLTITGGTTPYSVTWSDPLVTGEDPTGLVPGQYSPTITDANNCQIDTVVTVTTPNQLAISVTADSVSCNGGDDGSIDLMISGGTAPYDINWSTSPVTDPMNPDMLSAGSYSVTVTDSDTCSVFATVIVHEPTPISLSTTFEEATCGDANGSIDLTVSGGTAPYTFDWLEPNVDDVEDPGNLPAGQYNVVVTDANGCTAATSETVTTPDALSLSLSANDVSCFGGDDGSVISTISGGVQPYSFSWTPNVSSDADALDVPAGSYTLVVTDANDCTITATAQVQEPPQLTATAVPTDALCNGSATGSIDVTVQGGTPDYSYSWTPSIANIEDPSNLPANNYTVVVEDAQGCTTTASATVGEPAAIVLSIQSDQPSCFGGDDGSVNLTVSGGTTPYSYNWSLATIGDVQDPQNLSAGLYSVTVTDANNCTQTISTEVSQPTGMSLSFTLSSFGSFNVSCPGNTDGEATASVTGGTSPYSYSWSNGSSTPTASNLAEGTYDLVVTDAEGCTIEGEVTLVAPQPVIGNISTLSASCFGEEDGRIIVESVDGGIGGFTYSFNGGAFTTQNFSPPLPAGEYPVAVMDAAGCEWMGTAVVDEPVELVVDLGEDQEIELGGGAAEVFPVVNPPSTALDPNTTLTWLSPLAFDCPPEDWPCEVSPPVTTRYTLRVIDERGCQATDEMLVRVSKPREVYIPNAFSPNGDGFNDFFYLTTGQDVRLVRSFLIFDRWGEKVFESYDFQASGGPDANAWSGFFKNEVLNPGVYVYYAEIEFIDGEILIYEGDVTLVR